MTSKSNWEWAENASKMLAGKAIYTSEIPFFIHILFTDEVCGTQPERLYTFISVSFPTATGLSSVYEEDDDEQDLSTTVGDPLYP